MQARIASSCFRARGLFFDRAETVIVNSCRMSFRHNPIIIPSRPFCSQTFVSCQSRRIFTRQLSTKHKPWESSRTVPYLHNTSMPFSQIPRPGLPNILFDEQGPIPKGLAMFSTSTGGDVMGAIQDAKQVKSTTVVKGVVSEEGIPSTKIVSTLAKYLWMKDNLEFRLRVIAAFGFLGCCHGERIDNIVLNVQVPFLFKLAVDWLNTVTGNASALADFTSANSTVLALVCEPRSQLRTTVFSKVALRTIRSVSRKVFSHLLELDLQYHLSR
ncbi:unnamed protein product [Ilex paraguariensis]|uniref:Uncharacterized protein n=1 Tax=Ilex paraguariensis TaxID=185542 RepID=A0ABC8RH26_9AQUA